jgi:pimeloyl-ACP methyl ester carboxylesterase
MIVDLVNVFTRDGVRLDGALQSPGAESKSQLQIDACLFVHGTGGSFYSSTLFDIVSECLVGLGCAALRVNTRGHDLMSTALTTQGGRRTGAAYEVVDECRHDIAAWLGWLEQRSFRRIALIGHSLGAVKAIYTLAAEPFGSVACLLAVSPPRLSFAHFSSSDRSQEFIETYRLAQRYVQSGKSGTLMEVLVPLPFVATAGGYVEKYGPEEQYNILRHIGRVPCPTLVTFGSAELESNMAFRGLPELIEPIAREHGRMRVAIVPGADHFYSRQQRDLAVLGEAWLRTLST